MTKKKIENRSHAEDELTLSSIREATGLICTSLNSWPGTQEAFNKHLAEWFDEWDIQMTEGKRTEIVSFLSQGVIQQKLNGLLLGSL